MIHKTSARRGVAGRGRRVGILALIALIVGTTSGWTQDDDEDFRPGLIEQTLRHGQPVDQRVVTQPFWSADAKDDTSERAWRGLFLVRSEGRHQFHAYLQGTLRVRLGEQVVLDAERSEPGWVSGPEVELEFGERPIVVTASAGKAPSLSLRLFWSSDTFPLESLPYHAFFHEEDSSAIKRREHGEQLLQAWRCGSCHGDSTTHLPGPSLRAWGQGTDRNWARERLTRVEPHSTSRMPSFGFTTEEAEAVLAVLSQGSSGRKFDKTSVSSSAKDAAAGAQLIKSVGCLACHSWQGLGQTPLLGGGTLDGVAGHRTAAWLEAHLREPAAVNPSARMPRFELSDQERRQVLAALVPAKSKTVDDVANHKTPKEQVLARGRQLIQQARCGACHQLPEGIEPWKPVEIPETGQVSRGTSCVAADVARKPFQPRYASEEQEAIAAAWPPVGPSASPVTAGASLLWQKGCLNCHDRNGRQGLSGLTKAIVATEPSWEGQAPTLQPPPLTAVGDRLQDEALMKGVRGELPRRMDWLRVRMPKFAHTPDETAALTAALIAEDRIPDHPPATSDYPISSPADPQTLLAGRELTGGKGFSCVACHQLKDYVPPKVALGTRGSDLYGLGKRMRAPYFFRWTSSPLRILPGVEMPSYQRPHPTILAGDIQRQLAAIWEALHDPNFTAPTNPAVVEQLWGPSESGRPRVLRDVVTIPSSSGSPVIVPRAFAVGFANRQNVLFDTELGALRSWTVGDFARQRTQGKSWFWDPAGVSIISEQPDHPDVVLVADGKLLAEDARVDWLGSRITDDQAVEVDYRLTWGTSQPVTVDVHEIWRGEEQGWSRQVTVSCVPEGYRAFLTRPALQTTFGQPVITASGRPWHPKDKDEGVVLTTKGSSEKPLVVRYRTEVTPLAETVSPPDRGVSRAEAVTCIPGLEGTRLPLPAGIMPTALAWNDRGELHFTSLKGHVYKLAGDGSLVLLAEGLSAPYGLTPVDQGWLVAHKPEVVLLEDFGPDGHARRMKTVVSGWGFTEDYHDWTCGIARDQQGRFYIGLGSDYAHKNRPKTESRWRGHILRFDLKGTIEPIATGLRYPTGLAMGRDETLIVSDQQGVQNCFNELNVIQPGKRYGVPAQLDPRDDQPAEAAAIQIPHPWTRSVNGLAVWPDNGHPFAGHVIGTEYNERFLIRASLEQVNGVWQGAVYPLHRAGSSNGPEELLGPLCVGFSPEGDLYVGSIHDSGWLGGLNTGDIVRFRPQGQLPNGIREVRATKDGFAIEFLRPIDPQRALSKEAYKLSGYTRLWEGNYATPDSGRFAPEIRKVQLSDDGRVVELAVDGLKLDFVYEISVGDVTSGPALWPNTAAYTLHQRL